MFTCVWMLAFLIHERSMCEGPLPCKHYLISVMQRGPWPPRCVPSLWELKSTWLAGTKSRPPLPPAPAPAAPAHLPTKGATGPKFPGNDINGAPPTPEDEAGGWKTVRVVGEKWQRSHKRDAPPPPPPLPRGPFVGFGGARRHWGNGGKRMGVRRDKGQVGESCRGQNSKPLPPYINWKSLSNRYPIAHKHTKNTHCCVNQQLGRETNEVVQHEN